MNAPMTPGREQEIRTLDLLELMSDRVAPVISGHLAALLAEVDRLRAESSQLSNDLTGAFLDRHEEEQESARLRLALESARRGRRELRARVSRLENSAALAEEDYGRIVRGACLVESQLRARIAELEARPSRAEVLREASESVYSMTYSRYTELAKDTLLQASQMLADNATEAEDPHDGPLSHPSAPGGDLPKGAAPKFFEPGHTYAARVGWPGGRERFRFICERVATDPETGQMRAIGQHGRIRAADGVWLWTPDPRTYDDWRGGAWTDITDELHDVPCAPDPVEGSHDEDGDA
ncbi:hypothetical protein ACIOZL_19730 [Streptomyces sp. NPDC087769]|uniref:hypothetical protein n=1 Tax=Streptomyces sp. NPDC087769 TaxID=3365802 RepID=UPI0037F9BBC7